MEQVYTPKQNYKVLVRCFTYNQSKYIEDALNGFAMQKTDFPFVCLVMDDASTDGEQEVIKAWMERECDMGKAENVEIEKSFITLVPHKTNSSCTFAFYFLKENLYKKGGKMPMVNPWREYCEHEALCEGDDYWIDGNKLQKQVAFMDTNPEYAMCYSPCRWYYEVKQNISNRTFGGDYESFKDLIKENVVPTPTAMVRQSTYKVYRKSISPEKRNWQMGDYPLWLFCAHEYKVKCMKDEVLAVYRVLENSASHSSDYNKKEKFIYGTVDIIKFFIEYFNEAGIYDSDIMYGYLFSNAVAYGKVKEADIFYKKMHRPSFVMKIKHFIIKNNHIYNIVKGKLFYSLDR